MVLVLPAVLAVVVGLALRGDVRRLAALELRHIGLFYAAFAVQVLAFPFAFLPWRTADTPAGMLWLASYALLFVAAAANRRITGVPVIAAGMLCNVAAILVNGGSMPALPRAVAGMAPGYEVANNSASVAEPRLAWLVDRWAVPDWLPVGNVFSIGDVVIAAGTVVLVLAAMGVVSAPGRRAVREA